MNKGDKVFYNGEEFEIYFIYESGYCEIKRPRQRSIMLVDQKEIQKKNPLQHSQELSP